MNAAGSTADLMPCNSIDANSTGKGDGDETSYRLVSKRVVLSIEHTYNPAVRRDAKTRGGIIGEEYKNPIARPAVISRMPRGGGRLVINRIYRRGS